MLQATKFRRAVKLLSGHDGREPTRPCTTPLRWMRPHWDAHAVALKRG
jgi:hypothetical protein